MKTLKERFEAKLVKGDGCWVWTSQKDNGYGRIWANGRPRWAHRVAYQLYVGEIPDGLCVCHHCDNPSCVNPAHMFLGTKADNTHDCMSKGRKASQSGEKNGNVKLTEAQVRTIREKRENGVSSSVLEKEFGVAQRTISSIVLRDRWANV